jgi:hypothetical protein
MSPERKSRPAKAERRPNVSFQTLTAPADRLETAKRKLASVKATAAAGVIPTAHARELLVRRSTEAAWIRAQLDPWGEL